MPYGIYLSAEGAQMQAHRLEVLANNLANVNTPGFKRDVPTFQARLAEAIEQGQLAPGMGTLEDIGGGVLLDQVTTDYSQGTLQQTGMPTDVAIIGDGFFQIEGPEGEDPYLSRAGNFTIDGQGALVTQDGKQVLDDAGAPILLNEDQPWRISPDGFVVQGTAATALGLVSPASLGDLIKMGENMFRSLGPVTPLENRSVRQGFLEQSGVNPTTEMMALIESSRLFEANTKLIQHQDEMIDQLISRVLQS